MKWWMAVTLAAAGVFAGFPRSEHRPPTLPPGVSTACTGTPTRTSGCSTTPLGTATRNRRTSLRPWP